MRYIVGRKILKGYRIRLVFDDGISKTLDFEKILSGPVFGPLRNLRKFRRVKINSQFGCLEWPNGADLCPDALYRGYLPGWKNSSIGNQGIALDGVMTKRQCRTTYRLKVKSKKTGQWRWALVGCNRRAMEHAVRFYRERFGEEARIVNK